MEPKIGEYVSLDAKKVGQPRRGGVVRHRSKGLSGTRYEIEWDDGSRSMIFPGAGTLLVEGKKPKVKAKPKTKAKAKLKAKAKAQVKAKKPAAKKKK
jgi:hypothetical protein